MSKVLVTGGSGFLGTNLIRKLKSEGYYVLAPQSKWDLRKQDIAKKVIAGFLPDFVVHAAGSVGGIGANQKNPGRFMYENLAMGMNMIEATRIEAPKAKFVMLGTVCAYPKHTQIPFREEDLWNGYPEETNAPYGIAKKSLMKLVETYHEQYGFNGVNLVPVNMYGPHDHFELQNSHVIPAIILKFHMAMTNDDPNVTLWGTGQVSREFLYVEDCCDAIVRAIEANPGPEPINIGTGKEITIKELTETIAGLMGFDGNLLWDTTKPNGQPRRCLDTSRSKERLGFEAKTTLRDGLKETIAWFRENNNV